MGYYITLRESNFCIKAENKDAALAAMKRMWDPDVFEANNPNGGSWGPNGATKRWYSWMNNTTLEDGTCPTLEQGLTEWGWQPITDDEGNIIDIFFDHDKMGQEDIMFATIAPYVEDGSYLEIEGEDGSLWRWLFNKGEMREVNAVILWPAE